MGARVEHRELATSHSPFLSRPEETTRLVVEAVEAFAGTSVEGAAPVDETTEGRLRAQEALPVPRLWRPLTWFRFGLPLVFGHMIGRSILIFTWGRRLWRSR